MKNIQINYLNNICKVKIKKEKGYPNNLFKVEFENPLLLQIIESPIWIEEKGNLFSFIHINYMNKEQIELLNSLSLGIDEYYSKQ